MTSKNVIYLTQAATIATIYVVLGTIFTAVGNSPIQIRFAEALTILPLFTPAAIPGLFIGCFINNLLSGCILLDIICGSLTTLLGAFGTYKLRKTQPILGTLPPILANTIIIPLVLFYGYKQPIPVPYMMVSVGIGEIISCGVLGMILYTILKPAKGKIFYEL